MKMAVLPVALPLALLSLPAGPALAQGLPQGGQQGVPMYACPPGYICSPAPQPGQLPPRALTPEEIQAARGGVVGDAAGAILSPGEVSMLRDRGLEAQAAATWPGLSRDSLPEAAARTIKIADPTKRAPEKITLSIGVVSPITFLDKAGKPWPIVSIAYDQRTFAVDGAGCGGAQQGQQGQAAAGRPTTINVMPCRWQTFGTISANLEGLAAPIVLVAQSGFSQATIDLPVTVRITGASPETEARAKAAEAEARAKALQRAYSAAPATPRGIDPELDSFLTGVPPAGAESVRTDMPSVSAWLYHGKLYLKGPISVISPEFDAMGAGTDGQYVWRFARPIARVRVVADEGGERALIIGL